MIIYLWGDVLGSRSRFYLAVVRNFAECCGYRAPASKQQSADPTISDRSPCNQCQAC
ncbi:MAG: hypothetical protein JGK17_24990 [Microcoleus sp. PH2017_10_PVI_O_A]|uniref:hypothetical protein n=1 Tax=unclassified Microcoleus TaxID=2642155 RepID=UPI001D51DCC4|nr:MULTISPECIES: hypothetical protein [unclassified Microcoleus]MCC3408772.1 hypothetical protein [Microcoleus sp. PH2017_10_PVI_O_A]MCC3480809.1 hypothetical protein [Microcoleus sp. PH2017_12_PCY_D_A]MCC3562303.1 hypothetical protein [Microcoleus sp. PH2017_27_LUM_O_A]